MRQWVPDLQGLDTSHWVSFKTADSTIYFGEVVYVNPEGVVFKTKEQAVNAVLKRHGTGLQTYPAHTKSWYLGKWQLDVHSGQGKMVYPDGTFYQGTFKNGVRSDQGKMYWENAVYQGTWKNGRFEGVGSLTMNKKTHKGRFRNGYFQEGDKLINPFMAQQKGGNDIKLRQKQNKLKFFYFQRVKDLTKLNELLQKSASHNRVPIIFPSNLLKLNKSQIFKNFSRKVFQFDLRQKYLQRERGQYKTTKIQVRNKLAQSILQGHILAINLDDSKVEYQYSFYPDLSAFYDQFCFPKQLWDRERLEQKQVFQAVCGQFAEKNGKELVMKPEFSLMLWSKFRLNQDWKDQHIIQTVFNRLKPTLPIIKLDIILLTE